MVTSRRYAAVVKKLTNYEHLVWRPEIGATCK